MYHVLSYKIETIVNKYVKPASLGDRIGEESAGNHIHVPELIGPVSHPLLRSSVSLPQQCVLPIPESPIFEAVAKTKQNKNGGSVATKTRESKWNLCKAGEAVGTWA